MNEKLQWSLNF